MEHFVKAPRAVCLMHQARACIGKGLKTGEIKQMSAKRQKLGE
jgi:hypothetical protein